MHRITQYIISFSLFLLNSNIVGSQEHSSHTDHDETPNTATLYSPTRTQQTNIVSPTPRRFFITSGINNLEERLRKYEDVKQREFTRNEQNFRSSILNHMAEYDQIVAMNRELLYIRSFAIYNTTICLNDGYYRKVGILNHRNKSLSSKRFTSRLLPVWSLQPFEVQMESSYAELVYYPYHWGYAYKRADGTYWLWVDSFMIKQ